MDKRNSVFKEKGLVCELCGRDMELDDIDYRFKGCQDEYWLCSLCNTSAYVRVRYGKAISTDIQQGDKPCFSNDKKPVIDCQKCLDRLHHCTNVHKGTAAK